MVRFGAVEISRSIKTQFLHGRLPIIVSAHIQRPTLAKLIAVPSTVHLKMKYYTEEELVATLHKDIHASRIFFEAAAKGLSSINIQPRTTNKPALPNVVPLFLPLRSLHHTMLIPSQQDHIRILGSPPYI